MTDTETNRPLIPNVWTPRWLVDVGHEIMMGVTVDDGCYVALTQKSSGEWCPVTHIPMAVAELMCGLRLDELMQDKKS